MHSLCVSGRGNSNAHGNDAISQEAFLLVRKSFEACCTRPQEEKNLNEKRNCSFIVHGAHQNQSACANYAEMKTGVGGDNVREQCCAGIDGRSETLGSTLPFFRSAISINGDSSCCRCCYSLNSWRPGIIIG